MAAGLDELDEQETDTDQKFFAFINKEILVESVPLRITNYEEIFSPRRPSAPAVRG